MARRPYQAAGRSAAIALPEMPLKRWRAVHLWFGIGLFWLAVIAYIFLAWAFSGHVHPTPTGVTPVPESMRLNAIFWQVFLGLISALLGYFLVIKAWRREGQLTLFGMLYIASQTMWWQDALLNYFSPVFSYNSVLINWGSWNANVPGWASPNGERMPSPILLYLGLYPVFFCGATVLLVGQLARMKARWPRLGNVTLVSVMFIALGIFAVAAEGTWLRTGLYTYTGVASPITLWPSEAYKVPIVSVFALDSLVLTLFASLLFFRDDTGLTLVERGSDQAGWGAGTTGLVRCIAIIGAANTILFAGYNIPMNYLAIKGPGWAPNVLEKSYFTNGVCGDGSDYSCPGGVIPLPVGVRQLHLDPRGNLVTPAGTAIPVSVKSKADG